MKKQLREPAQKAIREMKDNNELNGYTWTVTSDGLKWSYLDVEFAIVWDEESKMLRAIDKHSQYKIVTLWVEDDKYADCRTLEEAYYRITQATIRKANNIY